MGQGRSDIAYTQSIDGQELKLFNDVQPTRIFLSLFIFNQSCSTTRTCIHTSRIQIGNTNHGFRDIESFSSNACFLRLAIVWHSMATLVGPILPTSFASDQLERSHGNAVFFSAMKGVIQEIYSETMKPSGPLTSKQPTTSVLFNGAAGGGFLPREFSSPTGRNTHFSLSCLSDIPTCISGLSRSSDVESDFWLSNTNNSMMW